MIRVIEVVWLKVGQWLFCQISPSCCCYQNKMAPLFALYIKRHMQNEHLNVGCFIHKYIFTLLKLFMASSRVLVYLVVWSFVTYLLLGTVPVCDSTLSLWLSSALHSCRQISFPLSLHVKHDEFCVELAPFGFKCRWMIAILSLEVAMLKEEVTWDMLTFVIGIRYSIKLIIHFSKYEKSYIFIYWIYFAMV